MRELFDNFLIPSWISKLFFVALAFLAPVWELYFLLIALVSIDYAMDFFVWFKNRSKEGKVWDITEPVIKKMILYSIMTVSVHAVQQHLIKESFDMFKLIMAIPIIAELGGILATVEKYTGVQLVDKLKEYINSWINSKRLP